MTKRNAGVWIDHRKALDGTDDSRWRAHVTHCLKGRNKALTGELNVYCDAAIAALRNADSFIILDLARPRAS